MADFLVNQFDNLMDQISKIHSLVTCISILENSNTCLIVRSQISCTYQESLFVCRNIFLYPACSSLEIRTNLKYQFDYLMQLNTVSSVKL